MTNTHPAECAESAVPAAQMRKMCDSRAGAFEPVLRLLIVDDEIAQDNPLTRMLESERIEATCAQSGTVGLAYARAGGFNAMLLDLKLPDILGMTVLSFIRAERLSLPVVVSTGHFLNTDHADTALHLGAAAFLAKPIFDAAELAAVIRRVVSDYTPPSDGEPYRAEPPAQSPRRACRPPRNIPGLGDLHARALAADVRAVEDIFCLLLPELRARLRRRFPMHPSDWIDEAVEDALLEYRERPSRYDPTRNRSLDGYLEYSAWRNLLNARDSARRRGVHETTNVPPHFWDVLRAPDPHTANALPEHFLRIMRTVRASLTPTEQIVHDLQMADQHDTAVYARVLHLDELPSKEQIRRVRRVTNAVSHTVRRTLIRLRKRIFLPSNG